MKGNFIMKDYDLERFVEAQKYNYDTALSEIRSGEKRSHWIWYIFPQLRGLGRSSRSYDYGIENLDEARSYLAHPVLGTRLIEITQALLALTDCNAGNIMGFDDVKLHSCMTLFAIASGEDNSVFHKALCKFFDGKQDPQTLELLRKK